MKSMRKIFIISMIFSLVIMGVVLFSMFLGPDHLEFKGKSFQELLEGGQLAGVVIFPIVMIVSVVIILGVMRTVAPGAIKNGITAPARVLEVRDTGVSVNDNPQVALLVEVTPKGQAPFQAEVKTLVSRLNAALVQPGIDIEVVFDSQKPTRIQVNEIEFKNVALTDTESRLKELNRLYDQGLITGEEFRAKKEEILKKL